MNDQVLLAMSSFESMAGNSNIERRTNDLKVHPQNDIQRQQQQQQQSSPQQQKNNQPKRLTNLTMGKSKSKSPDNLSLVSSADETHTAAGNDSHQRSSAAEQTEEDRHKRAEEKKNQVENDSHRINENLHSSNDVSKPATLFRFKTFHKRLRSIASLTQHSRPLQLVSFLLITRYSRFNANV